MTLSGKRPGLPDAQRRFEAFLRERGLKLTSERKELLKAVVRLTEHFDADHLHLKLKQQGKEISRATVYRTLYLLVQGGLVRKQTLGDQHAHYEAVVGDEHHDHLICLNCQKVIEFFREDLETLQDQICEAHRFQALHHSLQIFGLCDDCRGKTDAGRLASKLAHLHA